MLQIVDSSPTWPQEYLLARDELLGGCPGVFLEVEHIGSTAIQGLAAKPIIDIMAAVPRIEVLELRRRCLQDLGYEGADIAMPRRVFLRRGSDGAWTHHLHVVEVQGWATQKERLFRDWLSNDARLREEYVSLKRQLATETIDMCAYTKAKTAFVQRVLDTARTARGLPLVSAWD